MRFPKPACLLFVILLYCFTIPSLIQAEVLIPDRPRDYVVDTANIIDRGILNRLNGILQELERKSGVQFLVLTVNSLEGEAIETFSLSVAERWKLGEAGKDNGLLLLVSLSDRKYRFEVGYGLEAIIPDGFTGAVGREVLVPYFKAGDYGKGIFAGVTAIVQNMEEAYGIKIEGLPAVDMGVYKNREGSAWINALGVLVPLIFILIAISSRSRRYGGGYYGGFGGYGGGFGGSGFGGGSFGGGGGGGFGGGGSSGGW